MNSTSKPQDTSLTAMIDRWKTETAGLDLLERIDRLPREIVSADPEGWINFWRSELAAVRAEQ